MESFDKKAVNFFVLARIAEKLENYAESASTYFKALSAVNDLMLSKINVRIKDHSERFSQLKKHYPFLYEITDNLFVLYRRTYSYELEKEEVIKLRKNLEEVFKYAGLNIPSDNEIEERIKELFKR